MMGVETVYTRRSEPVEYCIAGSLFCAFPHLFQPSEPNNKLTLSVTGVYISAFSASLASFTILLQLQEHHP